MQGDFTESREKKNVLIPFIHSANIDTSNMPGTEDMMPIKADLVHVLKEFMLCPYNSH